MTDAVTTACLKSLECPVCWNLYSDPKQLNCGHTLCAECVTQLVQVSQTRSVGLGVVILCPECRNPTSVPSGGLKTNYRLMDLVTKMSSVGLNELHECSTCEKRWAAGELFTCKTCEDSFQSQVWICAVCALKLHKDHNVVESDVATKEERDAAVASIKEFATQGKETARRLMDRFEHSVRMCHTILEDFGAAFERYCATKMISNDELQAALEKAATLRELYAKATDAAMKSNEDAAELLKRCLALVREWDADAKESRTQCETHSRSANVNRLSIRAEAPRGQPDQHTSDGQQMSDVFLATRGGRRAGFGGRRVSFADQNTAEERRSTSDVVGDHLRRLLDNERAGILRRNADQPPQDAPVASALAVVPENEDW